MREKIGAVIPAPTNHLLHYDNVGVDGRKKIEKKNAGEEAEATKKLGIKIKEFIARLEAVVEEDADLNRNNRLTVTKLLMLREMRCVLYKKRMFVLVEYPFPGLVLDFEVPITCWTKRKY